MLSCFTYRLLEASHHAHGLLQRWLTPNQIQGKCKHYWTEFENENIKLGKTLLVLKPNHDEGYETKTLLVNLSRIVDFPVVLNRIKWTSTRENCTTLGVKTGTKERLLYILWWNVIWTLKQLNWTRMIQLYVSYLTPSVSFFSCAFWLWSWVWKSQDERFLHVIRVLKKSVNEG